MTNLEKKRLSIAVIIVTYNEEIHIERCIKNTKKYSDEIYIVDSFSTDKTVKIAKSLKAKVLQNKWKNYSNQFSWALKKIKTKSKWILRLDADEYLEEKLICEISKKLPKLNNDIYGVNFKRKQIFMNKWIKYGGRYPLPLLRLWRNGHGKIEDRWMDEHIVIKKGKTTTFYNNFCDHNLNNLSFFIKKHDIYATREAIDVILYEYKKNDYLNKKNTPFNVFIKRVLKEKFYNRLPLGLRSMFYFIYRYFLLLGFLDGKKGLIFHFLQGFWYRFLVDSKVIELKNAIKNIDKYKNICKKMSSVTGFEIK